jgi:hypothetical protein
MLRGMPKDAKGGREEEEACPMISSLPQLLFRRRVEPTMLVVWGESGFHMRGSQLFLCTHRRASGPYPPISSPSRLPSRFGPARGVRPYIRGKVEEGLGRGGGARLYVPKHV